MSMMLISWIDIRMVIDSVFYPFIHPVLYEGWGEDRYGIHPPQSTFSPSDSPNELYFSIKFYILKKKILFILEIDIHKT